MRISELISRLETIQEREGDIEVELPDGRLMRRVQVVTRSRRSIEETVPANGAPQSSHGLTGGKA